MQVEMKLQSRPNLIGELTSAVHRGSEEPPLDAAFVHD